jgi:hypothetical protein
VGGSVRFNATRIEFFEAILGAPQTSAPLIEKSALRNVVFKRELCRTARKRTSPRASFAPTENLVCLRVAKLRNSQEKEYKPQARP